MNPTLDFVYGYRVHGGKLSTCRVRVWKNDLRTIVLLTEMPDNPGMSVTNAAEQIATQLLDKFELQPSLTTWIEHYPREFIVAHGKTGNHVPETFDTLDFTWSRRKAIGVEWHRISQETLEGMIGEPWQTETVRAGLEI